MVNPDGITDMPGDGEVTYPSETGQALIPYQITEETYDYYEVRNYVNDINQDYTQVLTGYDEKGRIRESYTYGITGNSGGESSSVTGTGAAIGGRLDYSDSKNTWYYGYTGTGSVAQLTDKAGALAATYRYDAFGNTSVQDYIGNITGNKKITENYTRNPYTFNAEYTDASTGNQYLRARYYSPETGNFFTEDSYLGSLLEPLERNLYTYAENDPVNYSDPSGHGILSKAWKKVKSMAAGISGSVRKGVSQLLGNGRNIRNVFSSSVSKVASSLQSRIFKGASSIGAILGTRNSRVSTAYQRAKASGQSTYKWEGSRAKEAKNIQLSWTKALENTMKHFCTTAKMLEKQVELARLKARKDAIRVSGNQKIAVTGSMSFGAVVDSLINSGIAAEAAESLASKLVSLAAGAAGPFVAVLGGTALLWWFSPIEAGESEEQATAWMKKEDQKKMMKRRVRRKSLKIRKE